MYCSNKMIKRKLEKQNVIKYATWNVRGITHKEEELDSVLREEMNSVLRKELDSVLREELDSVLREKQTEVAAITEKKFTMETNNYTVIYNGYMRKVSVMIGTHKSIKNTIINCKYGSKRITGEKNKIL
jgi:hypothetical protein